MAATVSWERLRELAGFRAEKGCAVSLYLNLDPRITPTAGDVQSHFHSLLDQASRSTDRAHLGHDQRVALKEDLERIRHYLERDFERNGAQGLAVFSAALDKLWSPLALTAPVPDEVKVNAELYLTPLVPLVGRGEGALVAVVGRERGELYRLRAGRLEELVDRSEEQPGRHDQGGWSQARYQRHIETLVANHLRRVADELDRIVRRRPAPIVVVATEETWAEFAELLSKEVRKAIAGWTSAEAHARPAELLGPATELLERQNEERETAALERWREEAGRSGRAASGWAATLEAASDGRIELLLYQQGTEHDAWRCPACGRLSLEGGKCPLDGTELEHRAEGLDLAIHQTLAHGGSVLAVTHRADLEPVGSIGALLRF
jgi:peptide chain release factor subunit 1